MNQVLIPPLSACPTRPRGAAVRILGGPTMGTTWSLKFAGADIDVAEVEAAVRRELDLVTAQMSPWEPSSALCAFNAACPGAWVSIPSELETVVAEAMSIAHETQGAFDPTVGRLTDLWGFGPTPFRGEAPPDGEVRRRLSSSAGAACV